MPLYLGNIAAEVKQDQLEAEFSKFGKCEIHFYVVFK